MISNTIKDVVFWTHLGVPSIAQPRKPIDIPFISYFDYKPCLEANAFMHHLAVSRNLKPTTIRTYADKIVHLIRFIERQPTLTRFSQLTNSSFTLFIQNLTLDKKPNGEPRRTPTEVAKIGETCLQFLEFISTFHDVNNFIGVDEANAITVIKKRHTIRMEGTNKTKDVFSTSHTSLPKKGTIKTRHPVSKDDALKIWEHIKTQKKDFSYIKKTKARRLAKREQYDKRKRDVAIYTAMEMIGGRVGELHSICFSDYLEARRTGKLRIHTSKKRDNEDNERYIPVDNILLEYIAQYAEVRKRIMKKFSVKHDFLFISLNDGHPFSKTSWTTYINSWGRKLGIVGKVSPHLWRHARFTNWMIERILTSQEINSKDDFKKNILHTQQFKKELQQYSGHKLISSLDNYLNLAWEQLHGYKEVYSAASLKTAVDTMQEQMDYLEQRIDRKELSVVQALQDIKSAMFAFKKDVAASVSNTKED